MRTLSRLFHTMLRLMRGSKERCRVALTVFLAALLLFQSLPTPVLAAGAEAMEKTVALAFASSEGESFGASEADGEAPDDAAQPSVDAPAEGTGADVGQDAASNGSAGADTPVAEPGTREDAAEQAADASSSEPAPSDGAAEPADSVASVEPGEPSGQEAASDAEASRNANFAHSDEFDLDVVTVEGAAAASKSAAATALTELAGVSGETAGEASAALFAEPADDPQPLADEDTGLDIPSEGDGSFVNNISVRWITEDDVPQKDAGANAVSDDAFQQLSNKVADEAYLYQRPTSNADMSVRMRVNFALSGERPYEAGDIHITIPASLFTDREGAVAGTMRLSMPEYPSTSADWNYQLVGDEYVITNTRTMSAATQGYMEFLVEGLTPNELVDMQESAPFSATIEVTTYLGNVIGLRSEEITAAFDTHAEIQSATKRPTDEPVRVKAEDLGADIPAGFEDEEYVVVTWYSNGYVPLSVNQNYDLALRDVVGTTYNGISVAEGEETEIEGFILGQTGVLAKDAAPVEGTANAVDRAGASYFDKDIYTGYNPGSTNYTTYKVAYPLSQFEKGETYTFTNQVLYTLTEVDPDYGDANDPQDKQQVTYASAIATTPWRYEDPVFIEPEGHFNHYKYGNSHTPYGNGFETINPYYYTPSSDLRDTAGTPGYSGLAGYYGIYPSALNTLHSGNDQEISYTLNSIGFLLPWTYSLNPQAPEGGNPRGILSNYGQRAVTMTTEDTGLSIDGQALELGTDYVYAGVEFPRRPCIQKAVAIHLDENGNVQFESAFDGTVDYEPDDDYTKVPDVVLQVRYQGSEWTNWATASWRETGELRLTLTPEASAAGASVDVDGQSVRFPAGVDAVRTQVTATNAAVLYHVRVDATLLHGGRVGELAGALFEESDSPSLDIDNTSTMVATQQNAEDPSRTDTIATFEREGFDRLYGYTTETRITAEKTAELDEEHEQQVGIVHYTAEVSVQSFISDRTTYEAALADGTLQAEEGATWYDLLPEGMVPDLGSVTLRDGDAIRSMYTLENYQGSGRTLLVVSADLTPVPTTYENGDLTYYEDVITLKFDATYSTQSMNDYGADTHNVVAYQSDNDHVGSVEHYIGENDPYGSNNDGTESAFAEGEQGEEEQRLLNTLVTSEETTNFVYAGADCRFDLLSMSNTSIEKTVMTNFDGCWSTGVENIDNDNGRDVYVGGNYSYRLSFGSGEDTRTENIIIYDLLETYQPTDDNNGGIDTGAPRWHGTFAGVDLTALEELGCAPVVYYSTDSDLCIEKDGVNPNPDGNNVVRDEAATDLTDTTIWNKWTPEVDPAMVKAIAIDARKKADGSNFELAPEQTCSAYVHMRAPQGAEAAGYIEEGAHAYNNVYMNSWTYDANNPSVDHDTNFIREDYTKVGLVNYRIDVEKIWDDANNQDGIRPDSVTVHLWADLLDGNGSHPAEEVIPEWIGDAAGATRTLNAANEWKASFENIPYLNDDGQKIVYTLHEENKPEGYVANLHFDGVKFTATNSHEPEKIAIEGTKTWVGDTEGTRPDSIKVDLFANGELVQSQTVRADVTGDWSYRFDNLDRYEPGKQGEEITYTVEEDVSSIPSYIPSTGETAFDLVNTYHPYGDLIIKKFTQDTTEKERDDDFTFTLTFGWDTGEVDEAGEAVLDPVFDEFAYTVTDAEGNEVREDSVSTGGSIALKAGEQARVAELPEGICYRVDEAPRAGYTAVVTGAVGEIAPNEDQEAAFTNTYAASGSVSLQAVKRLTGRDLNQYMFNFLLKDEDGTVVRTASNAVPTSEAVDADGNKVESAPVTFGALTYTQADAEQAFTYTISEVSGGAPGYTYSEAIYTVKVVPHDNGDGTMSFSVTYQDAEGNIIASPVDPEAGVVFENTYTAAGSLTLSAVKSTVGGPLDAFMFELGEVVVDEDGTATFNQVGDQAKNDPATGVVRFDPITYDQTDIGRTIIYAMHEVPGEDETITYDSHWAYVQAKVTDNGNGTLSVATQFGGFEAPCLDCDGDGVMPDGESCSACDGDGSVSVEQGSTDFVNRYVDGELDIQKTVQGEAAQSQPNQIFTFRVELTNEEGQKLDGVTADNVKFEQLADAGASGEGANVDDADQPKDVDGATERASDAESAVQEQAASDVDPKENDTAGIFAPLSALGDLLSSIFLPTPAYAEEIASGEGGNGLWHWSLDDAGTLTISGTEIAVSGELPENVPWYEYRSQIKAVYFEKGASARGNLNHFFNGASNLTSVVWNGFSTDSVLDMSSMFQGCSSLASLDLSGIDTSSVTTMSRMFDSCSSLASVNLSGLDTSKVTSMYNMFYGCSSLTSVNLSGLDTSKVTSMYQMFKGCSSLASVDLSVLDTSSVTTMSQMFSGCTKLESADLSGLNAPSVTTMSQMFKGCSSLASVDLSVLDTSSVTTMAEMFSGCTKLVSADLSDLNAPNVTNMSSMFMNCHELAELNLSGFIAQQVESMNNMFSNCEELTSLDLSGLSVSSTATMQNLFLGCEKLSSITLSANFKWVGTGGYLPNEYNWIRIDTSTGLPVAGAQPLTSAELGAQYPECGVGTYVWDGFIAVTYDANDAGGRMPEQVINAFTGGALTPVGSSLQKSGYVFDSWNTADDGSGTSFADGQQLMPEDLKVYIDAGELTLYAQWKKATDVVVSEDGVLTISMPAGYVAHIPNLPAGTSYRVFEETPDGWKLVGSSGTTGAIVPGQVQTAAFVNEYSPDDTSTSAQIVATKYLDGVLADAESGFSFELVDAGGKVLQTKQVDAGGNIVFNSISYDAVGEYAYTIREVSGEDTNIFYDETSEKVTVTVTQGDDGLMSASVAYDHNDADPDVARFDNTTKTGALAITKAVQGAQGATLSGAASKSVFTFMVSIDGKPYSGAYVVGDVSRETLDGTINLAGGETAYIDGLKMGSAYEVSEIDLPAGWTAEKPEGLAGKIESAETVRLSIANVYDAAGSAQLRAYKNLPGMALADGAFSFELVGQDDAPMPVGTKDNRAVAVNGAVDTNEFKVDEEGNPTTTPNPMYGMAPAYFPEIAYTLADAGKTYTYEIREIKPQTVEDGLVPGVTYDTSVWTATVEVADKGDGTLATTVAYTRKSGDTGEPSADINEAIFTNTPQDTQLKVQKNVQGADELSEAAKKDLSFAFTISLRDAEGDSLEQGITGTVYDAVTNESIAEREIEVHDGGTFWLGANQYVLFEDVPYGTAYEVTEQERPGWSQVAEGTSGASGVTGDERVTALFTNGYAADGEVVLRAAKLVEGKLPAEGAYSFLLYEVTGLEEGAEPDLTQPLQRVSNDADGNVVFSPIAFTDADTGAAGTCERVFQIREFVGTEEDMRYDETVVEARVTVTDRGNGTLATEVTYVVDGRELSEEWYTFQNWLKITLAHTGGPGVWAAGAAGVTAVGAGCAALVARRRKRSK